TRPDPARASTAWRSPQPRDRTESTTEFPSDPPDSGRSTLQAGNQLLLMSFQQHTLVLEQPALALETATVAYQRSAGPDDSMARDDDGDWVRAVGSTHRAGRGRRTDGVGDVAVRRGAASGHRSEGAPDPQLKRRSHRIDGQRLEGLQVAGEIRAKRTDGTGRIRGGRDEPATTQPPPQLGVVVALEVGTAIAKLNSHQEAATREDGERTER